MSGASGIVTVDGDTELNPGRERVTLKVKNVGDRAAQVGSHYHFFEANKCLDFDRNAAFGFRLDIPAGTAIRFEPGSEHTVTLVALAGTRRVIGLAGLTNGYLDSTKCALDAKQRAKHYGFNGAKG